MMDYNIMSTPFGTLEVDGLSIVPEWNIKASNRSLCILQNDSIKQVFTSDVTKDYFLYYSPEYSMLTQSSYFVDRGNEISLNIQCELIWQSQNKFLIVPLPSSLAKSSVIGNAIITWNEDGVDYSTKLSKCNINEDRNSVVISSTILAPGRIVSIKAHISYVLENTPNTAIYL